MSFAQDVKSEIGQNILNECCKTSQLSAFLKTCSTILINNNTIQLRIKIENPTIAKRIWSLMKERFNPVMELSIMKKMNLKKNNVYYITVITQALEILNSCGLWTTEGLSKTVDRTIVRKECCARAYLAGAFLASGSINSPLSTSYHLEIRSDEKSHAEFLVMLMKRFRIAAKITQRRNKYIVYIKASETISDFLRSVGAHQALMTFEDQRIQRDFTNNFVRLDNCELANEVKTIKAAQKQIEYIQVIKDYQRFEMLDEKLQVIANLRQQHPEYSLNELGEAYQQLTGQPITKSGVKHRLNKIKEYALELAH